MRRLQLLVLALALLGPAPAFAGDVEACAARILRYDDPRATKGETFLRMGERLLVYGARHSRDPEAAQFAEIDALFQTQQPTLVFFEGPDRGVGADPEDSIRTRGESGYLRFLASRAGAPARSLEPPPADQVRHLSGRFPADQVALFFVLREATRMRDREGLSGPALDAAVARMLERAGAMQLLPEAAGTLAGLDALQAAYARYWKTPARWQDARSAWFDPVGRTRDGRFLHALNRADSAYRDQWMYRQLARAALGGERVMAVVGRNHLFVQADALRCALE
jgi:hypothetical protein